MFAKIACLIFDDQILIQVFLHFMHVREHVIPCQEKTDVKPAKGGARAGGLAG